jgi:hypothetical protein
MYVRYVVDVVEEEHVLESEKTIFLVFNAYIPWLSSILNFSKPRILYLRTRKN